MKLDPHQIARGPKYPPNANDWSGLFNPAHEETLRLMFRGKNRPIQHSWTDEEIATFPPGLTSLWSTLFAPVIGRDIKPEEVPALLSLGMKVTHHEIAGRCWTALERVIKNKNIEECVPSLHTDAVRVLKHLRAHLPSILSH